MSMTPTTTRQLLLSRRHQSHAILGALVVAAVVVVLSYSAQQPSAPAHLAILVGALAALGYVTALGCSLAACGVTPRPQRQDAAECALQQRAHGQLFAGEAHERWAVLIDERRSGKTAVCLLRADAHQAHPEVAHRELFAAEASVQTVADAAAAFAVEAEAREAQAYAKLQRRQHQLQLQLRQQDARQRHLRAMAECAQRAVGRQPARRELSLAPERQALACREHAALCPGVRHQRWCVQVLLTDDALFLRLLRFAAPSSYAPLSQAQCDHEQSFAADTSLEDVAEAALNLAQQAAAHEQRSYDQHQASEIKRRERRAVSAAVSRERRIEQRGTARAVRAAIS